MISISDISKKIIDKKISIKEALREIKVNELHKKPIEPDEDEKLTNEQLISKKEQIREFFKTRKPRNNPYDKKCYEEYLPSLLRINPAENSQERQHFIGLLKRVRAMAKRSLLLTEHESIRNMMYCLEEFREESKKEYYFKKVKYQIAEYENLNDKLEQASKTIVRIRDDVQFYDFQNKYRKLQNDYKELFQTTKFHFRNVSNELLFSAVNGGILDYKANEPGHADSIYNLNIILRKRYPEYFPEIKKKKTKK